MGSALIRDDFFRELQVPDAPDRWPWGFTQVSRSNPPSGGRRAAPVRDRCMGRCPPEGQRAPPGQPAGTGHGSTRASWSCSCSARQCRTGRGRTAGRNVADDVASDTRPSRDRRGQLRRSPPMVRIPRCLVPDAASRVSSAGRQVVSGRAAAGGGGLGARSRIDQLSEARARRIARCSRWLGRSPRLLLAVIVVRLPVLHNPVLQPVGAFVSSTTARFVRPRALLAARIVTQLQASFSCLRLVAG